MDFRSPFKPHTKLHVAVAGGPTPVPGYAATVNNRALLAAGVVIVGLVMAGCSSGSKSPSASPTVASTTTPATAPSATTAPPASTATTVAVAGGTPICPTMAQADGALGVSDNGPIRTPTAGGGIVCEYTGSGGNAGVTIFAHQSASVFAGQVAHAPGAPAMAQLSGVGDGAFGMTAAGRSIVNAYSNSSRTLVAAQAPGALAPVEALARVALADN